MNSKEILTRCAALQDSKGVDYTSNVKTNQFENFDRAAMIASWFNDPFDKPFAVLIGVKLARLATLINKTGEPNHESVIDTFIDLTNYCALWGGRHD